MQPKDKMLGVIGRRTLKTGIAVTISAIIAEMIDLGSPLYAVIATIITLERSLISSVTLAKNRMLGTILGALIGMLCALIAPENPFVIGLGTILIILICVKFKWHKAIALSVTMLAIIMLSLSGRDPFQYTLSRLLDTFVGIIVGLLVNIFLLPYDYGSKIIYLNLEINKQFDDFLEGRAVSLTQIKENISVMKESISFYNQEFKYSKTNQKEVAIIETYAVNFDEILMHFYIIDEYNKMEEKKQEVYDYHRLKAYQLINNEIKGLHYDIVST